MTLQKATLEGNILPKGKQKFRISGLPEVIVLTRATIDVAVGAIELPDATKVSGGRVAAGEFAVTLQFGDDHARKAYIGWFNEAKDRGDRGVSPNYKRTATITFLRAFQGTPDATSDSGNARSEVMAVLRGVWCMSYVIPDGDIDATEGDGYSQLECTLSYDDAEVEV